MANIKDLHFTDINSFKNWAVERIKNVFLALERNKNIKLTLDSYNAKAADTTNNQDYWCLVFKYSYENKNNWVNTNVRDFSVIEIKELFEEESLWPILEKLMSRSRWTQFKESSTTNDYVELCLAGWIFIMVKDYHK